MSVKNQSLSIVLVLILIIGCATTTNSPLDTLAQRDVLIGAAVGATSGAIIGGVIDGTRGTIIGTVIGTAVGAVVGDIAAQRRRQFASEVEFQDAEIASAESAISSKERQLASLEANIEKMKTDINGLEQRVKRNEDVSKEAQQRYDDLSAQIQNNEQIAVGYKNSLDYLDEILKRNRAEAAKAGADREALEDRAVELNEKKIELTAQYARLNGITDQLREQQTRLESLRQST